MLEGMAEMERHHLFLEFLLLMLAVAVLGLITLEHPEPEEPAVEVLAVFLELLILVAVAGVHQAPLCLLAMVDQASLSLAIQIFIMQRQLQPDRLLYTKQTVTGFISLLVPARLHFEVKHGELCTIK
jgi:hypothetical protein